MGNQLKNFNYQQCTYCCAKGEEEDKKTDFEMKEKYKNDMKSDNALKNSKSNSEFSNYQTTQVYTF